MDFEERHSRDGGRDLIETSESGKLAEAVQVEKSTFFEGLPELVSMEAVHEAGEGAGEPAGNVCKAS